jgi:hypothetical protein
MATLKPDERPRVTPLRYHCKACGQHHQMLIEHPWWVCPYCRSRLVPADLDLPTLEPGKAPGHDPDPSPPDRGGGASGDASSGGADSGPLRSAASS